MPPGQLRRRHYAAVGRREGTLQLGAQVALERSGAGGIQVQYRAIADGLGVAVLARGAIGWTVPPHGRGEDNSPSHAACPYLETPPQTWVRLKGPINKRTFKRNTPTGVGKTENRCT